MPFKVIEYRQLVQILVMFMIVQSFGLLLAVIAFNGTTLQSIQQSALFSTYSSALFYIGYLVIASLLILLIFRLFNAGKVFRIFEAVLIFISSFIVFSILLGLLPYGYMSSIPGLPFGLDAALAAALAIGLVAAKNHWPWLRNTAAIISSAGVGLILGLSFTFTVAVVFMALLAVYDFIAVFITKHMLSLARVAEENNLALLIGVNEVEGIPKSLLDKKTLAEYAKASKVHPQSAVAKALSRANLVPIAARVELGTGDLAVPLMVAVSAYGVSLNFVLSFVIMLGALLGLLITMLILRKYKRALPAIPPLLLGILISLGLYFLVQAVMRMV